MRRYRHWVVLVRPLGLAVLLVVAVLGLDVVAPVAPRLRLLATLVVGFSAGLWSIGAWARWSSFEVALTDQRVILEEGLLGRTTRVIALDRIQDIVTRQGPVGRLLGYGSLDIETAGAGGGRIIDHLPMPDRFRDAVFSQVRGRGARVRMP